tara:strand:- start:4415 stop:5542 length:1128 start_codon:yes stop_codon:yes gene_type:complete
MAYNVLKGLVEGSVDQYGDQRIEGVKVFKNTISASVFYDTDAESPCATMKDVAITKLSGGRKNGLISYDSNGIAKVNHKLVYKDNTLDVENVVAATFNGSAEGLCNIPVTEFAGEIKANFIKHGLGLRNVDGELQVFAGDGIKVEDGNVDINLNSRSGLSIKSKQLYVDPTKSQPITQGGQNLSDQDLLLVADISRNQLQNTTLRNLYDNYIDVKIPKASGGNGQLQIKNESGFGASEKLTYDIGKNKLNVDGLIVADRITTEGKFKCEGSVYKRIIKTDSPNYVVADDDYTILCDTVKNKVTVKLPPACNNTGRILIIKKVNTDKYSIKSEPINIVAKDSIIDRKDVMVIKMNYSSRMLQSDGENWWSIGLSGT